MGFDSVYYEPDALNYELGKTLQHKFPDLPWFPIESHNSISLMQQKPNSEFARMKKHLIIGIRKTHKYVENHKISDFLVPYTSSGCSAMCLYCYLVCNYNKCAYLRLFVNREQMMRKLIRTAEKNDASLTFEIGSNSDLVLENTITGNLEWTIEEFAKSKRGQITFPTKFDMVNPLLTLRHDGRAIFRMSVNPDRLIKEIELGTSSLERRIHAVNQMCEAGYPTGILVAPVMLVENWKALYEELFTILADQLTGKVKKQLTIEVIFMTYSYIHREINREAFPNAVDLYDKERMVGRGRGKYSYSGTVRQEAELFLREQISKKLNQSNLIYIC